MAQSLSDIAERRHVNRSTTAEPWPTHGRRALLLSRGANMKFDGKRVLAAGLAGMQKNALPGLALWFLALLLILADRAIPSAHAAFQNVGAWKERYGLAFSATTTAFFGGAVPFVFLLLTGRIRRDLLVAEFAFYMLFWSYKGVEVDLFYRLQSHLFGNHAVTGTIVRKVLVDQFIYNPIWAAPASALAFLWKESAFSWNRMKTKLGFEFMTFTVPVTLMSTWAVWIPAVAIIYCLPAPLQIPLFNLVLCFWVLVLSFISKRPADT
jgi:hypothetical protein